MIKAFGLAFSLGTVLIVSSFEILAGVVPEFADYPATEVTSERVKSIDFSSHPEAKTYKTHLGEAEGKSANFAGHYVVVSWGCGVSCQTVALVEVKSGKVFFAPFSTGLGSEFRAESTLFIDSPPRAIREYYGGSLETKNRLFYSYYYVWEEERKEFRLVYEETPKLPN